MRITVSRQNQTTPKQFKKYISVGANKTARLQFLLNDWQDQWHVATTAKKKDICYASDLVGYVIEVIEREIVKQF